MWQRLTVILAALFAIATAAPAQTVQGSLQGSSGGAAGTGGSCPQPVDNGCAAAPQPASFKFASAAAFGSHARQSGQTWSGGDHPENFNLPAVDYGVGTHGTLTNASAIHSTIPDCTFTAGGGSGGGPIVQCGATSNLDIEGFDFTNGGTNCTPLDIAANQSGTVTIKNNKWVDGVGCSGNATGGPVGPYFVFLESGSSNAGLDFESNDINGMSNSAYNYCVASFAWLGATIKYNAIRGCGVQTFNIFLGNPATLANITTQYNYGEDFGIHGCTTCLHGEWIIATASTTTATQANFTAQGDVMVQGSTAGVSGTTAFEYMTVSCCTTTTVLVDKVVAVSNLNGGQSPTSGLIETAGQTYTNVTLSNNYLDGTGALDPFEANGSTCTNHASFSGNFLLTTGAAHNAWDFNNGTGC